MFVRIRCRQCDLVFRVDAKHAGRRGKCPNTDCGESYVVPSAERIASKMGSHARKSLGRPGASDVGRPVASHKFRRLWPGRTAQIACGLLGLLVAGASLRANRSAGPVTNALAMNQASAGDSRDDDFDAKLRPFLRKYCIDCHNSDDPEGGLALDMFQSTADVLTKRKKWEHALKLVQAGVMPPDDVEQPGETEREQVIAWLDNALFFVDCAQGIDPGRVTIRRLNRAEYNNTVRDLLHVDVTPADDFPSDDVGYGFDNIGDVLSTPPLLMEKYLEAAEQVAAAAVMTEPLDRSVVTFERKNVEFRGSAAERGGGYVMASTGAVVAAPIPPRAGEYVLRVTAGANQAGDEFAKMRITHNGNELRVADVEPVFPQTEIYEFPVTLGADKQTFEVAFINDFYDPKNGNRSRRDRNLYVTRIELDGPLNLNPAQLPRSHKALFVATPGPDKSIEQAAREILEPFISRAFRRPALPEEVARYTELLKLGSEHGGSFEAGVRLAVQGILVSPHFLYRMEFHDQPENVAARRALNDWELATRLSYFLWSTMPDEELFRHAAKGDLHTDAVLETQVRRMLKDPRSATLVDNFAEQWLQLRTIDEIAFDTEKYPDFSPLLRDDMIRETKEFFASIVREDGRITDLLNGRYTFVNERLAKLYGLEGVSGDQFVKVSLEGSPRAGVTTQAGILALTSNPTRTSPVKRGKWVMETLLNESPPPAPPNVPALEETAEATPGGTLREQLELHRKDPGCAACHVTMDAIGFGLENFDAIGKWRDKDAGQAIDASGKLPTGEEFDGPLELVKILDSRQPDFAAAMAERMLTFALGRGTEYYDQCVINRIAQRLEAENYRFSALVTEIVKSEPFRMRRGEGVEQ